MKKKENETKEKKMIYLDPKADLPFKKVFGEHKNLAKSLLNALLPLSDDEKITDVEYLDTEMLPDAPWRKNTIVDVHCTDSQGRQFLVEMQLHWNHEFKNRVLLNAAKAFVRQSRQGESYMLLQPVWSLNLVNDVFEPDTEEYYHHYKMVNIKDTNKVIEGLQLVFVELPKFKPDSHAEKRMYNLWLRYLTEIDSETRRVSPDLTSNAEVEEAIEQLHISTFSDAQLYFYDRFWDAVSVENTWIGIAKKSKETGYQSGMAKGLEKGMEKGLEKGRVEGRTEGLQEGMEKGLEKGRAEGKAEGLKEAAANMKRLGISPEHIAQSTGIPVEEIKGL